jgi:hypothetical protein
MCAKLNFSQYENMELGYVRRRHVQVKQMMQEIRGEKQLL